MSIDEPDLPDLSALYSPEGPEPAEPASKTVERSTTSEPVNDWVSVVQQTCPLLYKLASHEGHLKKDKLDHLLAQLKLKPCDSDNVECLNRACASLWEWVLKAKTGKAHTGPHRGKSKEEHEVSRLLFSKDDLYAFRPNDLATMYTLNKIVTPMHGNNGEHDFRVTKRRGDMTLTIIDKPTVATIDGFTAIRWLQTEHQEMCDGFRVIYEMQTQSKTQSKLYVLQEATDGSLHDLIATYGRGKVLVPFLTRALWALMQLHKHGYQHNDVQMRNLLFVIGDSDSPLNVAGKWSSYDCVSPIRQAKCRTSIYLDPLGPGLNPDFFAFGMLVYEFIFGEHPGGTSPKRWAQHYYSPTVQDGIDRLRDDHDFQPVSTLAYHLITATKTDRFDDAKVHEWVRANN